MRWIPLLLLIACGAATTPAGKLGEKNIEARLPEGVKKTADSPTKDQERSGEVCAGDGSAGAAIKVRWDTFSNGESVYITNYSVEITRPMEGFALKLEDGPIGNANTDPDGPYIGAVTIQVKCVGDGKTVAGQIQIRADGKPGGPAGKAKK